MDEVFSRTEASGSTYSYLVDALGSTQALTDSTGTLTTQYTYDPYGQTSSSGSASVNNQQYTGRENDGTGLYYYRARYYQPGFGRFISGDPTDLAGGINTYGYVRGNLISRVDPLGLLDDGSHSYSFFIPLCSGCTTTDAFNAMRNFSAPGAPYAQDGTHDVMLWEANPIRQTVDPCNKTITNVTLPGHVFGGSLVISITDQNGVVGAQFVGAGNGPNATLNQYIGPVIFSALGVAGYINLNPSVGAGP